MKKEENIWRQGNTFKMVREFLECIYSLNPSGRSGLRCIIVFLSSINTAFVSLSPPLLLAIFIQGRSQWTYLVIFFSCFHGFSFLFHMIICNAWNAIFITEHRRNNICVKNSMQSKIVSALRRGKDAFSGYLKVKLELTYVENHSLNKQTPRLRYSPWKKAG